jgi:tRNA(fMet)-specific endonuclease VapC
LIKYLLDTNICIYIIKRAPDQVYERFRDLKLGQVGISSITYCELEFGISKSSRPEQNRDALNEFLGPLEVLDFPSPAAPLYGKVRNYFQKKGQPIGSLDLLIAAHALYLGVTLVTNNTGEFARVPNLTIENWV